MDRCCNLSSLVCGFRNVGFSGVQLVDVDFRLIDDVLLKEWVWQWDGDRVGGRQDEHHFQSTRKESFLLPPSPSSDGILKLRPFFQLVLQSEQHFLAWWFYSRDILI